MLSRRILLFLLAPGVLVPSAREPRSSQVLTRIESAKWQDKRSYLGAYTYILGRSCFCPEVAGGFSVQASLSGVDRVYRHTYRVAPNGEHERDSVRVSSDLQSYSIDAVLARAEAWRIRNPKAIEVAYDDLYGFPSRVHVDPDPGTSLDDTTLTVTDFSLSSPLR